MSAPEHITVGGAPEGFDARLILREVARRDGPVLHVARDDKRLEAMRAALAFFDPGMPVLHFPAGTVCPSTGCRPTPISRPRAWPRWPRWSTNGPRASCC